ncbi:MAG TPA: hypothetical protein VF656_05925 [Pyrinomonadaceae bacterium]|jgi:hypothetical protein
MDEAKQANPGSDTEKTGARQAEATSSDTLSDLQQAQADPTTSTGETSRSSDSSSAPSPDGTPGNEHGGTADGRDSGGPM